MFLHNVFGILPGQRHSADRVKTMFADCVRRRLRAIECPCLAAAANSRSFVAVEKSRTSITSVPVRASLQLESFAVS